MPAAASDREPFGSDWSPWTRLPLADRRLLIATGVPASTISDAGDVDLDGLRAIGWTVSDTELVPPPDPNDR